MYLLPITELPHSAGRYSDRFARLDESRTRSQMSTTSSERFVHCPGLKKTSFIGLELKVLEAQPESVKSLTENAEGGFCGGN